MAGQTSRHRLGGPGHGRPGQTMCHQRRVQITRVNCGESYTGRPKSNAVENEGKGDIRPTWTLMAAGVASNQTDMRTRWRRWEELEVLDKTVVCWGGTAYLGGNMENRGRQIDSCSL
jgi:hypothetical protein